VNKHLRKLTPALLAHWRAHPVEFIETVLYDPEAHAPFTLLPAERTFLEHAFKVAPNGKLLYNEWLYSCPKKSGKTTLEAIVALIMTLLYGGAFPESYLLANSLEQGRGRCFEICGRIVNASPLLKGEAMVLSDRITFPAFNAVIHVIPADAGSAAGTNSVCSGFDELWAYTSEAARRLWDEMTPPPTRKIACRLTVTYAGYEGESVLLEELYRRGLQQPKVGKDLHGGDGMLMFWSHKPIAPWQDKAWLASMRRERPSVYQRHVLNEFASSSAQFVDMAAWDACVDQGARPIMGYKALPIWAAIDASVKRDATAIAAVTADKAEATRVRLVNHRIFQPSKREPLNFEDTIVRTVRELREAFMLCGVYYDPFQMAAVAQQLQRDGIRMVEFPQTPANLTAIGSNLFELINSGNLLLYPDPPMRLAISRAVCKESARGLQITKSTASHKIDVVVALAMAAFAAVRQHYEEEFVIPDARLCNPNYLGTSQRPAPGLHKPIYEEPWAQYVLSEPTRPPGGTCLFDPIPGTRTTW